jgi:glycosyltransferase involved in cell wall biosynthesis
MKREDQFAAPPPGVPISDHPVVCVSHGFAGNYERGFCNGLAARGVAVTLIGSDRTDAAGLAPGVKLVNLRGSQEERRPKWQKLLNMLRYHASLLFYVLRCRDSTVHLMGLIDSPLLVGVLEGLWFRMFSRRYVMTVHNLLPHDRHTRWRQVAYGWCYRLPHRLVVHTARMKAELGKDFGIDPSRIVVMEHGIEPWPATQTPWAGTLAGDGVPMILLFGKVAPYKGVDLLLDALQGVSFPFRVVIAGACPSAAYRAELHSKLATHPRRKHVEWRDGFVADEVMESLFKTAGMVVLPYRHIDQSGVLFQALRYGVPIVASRVGQFESYVTSEVGELADPGSSDSLAAALERWAARRDSFSQARISTIGASYLWPSTVSALSEAYR